MQNAQWPGSICLGEPGHPLYRRWCQVLARVEPGLAGRHGADAEQCRRLTAQLLLEMVLGQVQQVCRVQSLPDGRILAVLIVAGQRQRRYLDPAWCTAHSVEQISRALVEACDAWHRPLPGD